MPPESEQVNHGSLPADPFDRIRAAIVGREHYVLATSDPGPAFALSVLAASQWAAGRSDDDVRLAASAFATSAGNLGRLTCVAIRKTVLGADPLAAWIGGYTGGDREQIAAVIRTGRDLLTLGGNADLITKILDAIRRGAFARTNPAAN